MVLDIVHLNADLSFVTAVPDIRINILKTVLLENRYEMINEFFLVLSIKLISLLHKLRHQQRNFYFFQLVEVVDEVSISEVPSEQQLIL